MNKYRNHDIQNEILSLMSNIVVRNIIVELMSTLMSTDECTAASYLEQLCFRWLDDDLQAHKYFIGFYQIPGRSANT